MGYEPQLQEAHERVHLIILTKLIEFYSQLKLYQTIVGILSFNNPPNFRNELHLWWFKWIGRCNEHKSLLFS